MYEAIMELAKVEMINNSMLYYLLELQIGEARAKRVYTKIYKAVNKDYEEQIKTLKKVEEILENECKHNNEKN